MVNKQWYPLPKECILELEKSTKNKKFSFILKTNNIKSQEKFNKIFNILGQKIKKGNKHVFKCDCGKDIIVMTNIYDNSNSGMGSCKCGATIYIN